MATAVSALSKFFSSFVPWKPPQHRDVISFSSPTSVKLPTTRSPQLVPIETTWVPSPKPSAADDITAVACPSLANANILFYFNVQIKVDDDDPEEKILRRFRSAVLRAGIIQECKRRRFFESTRDKKKRKTRSAAQRNRKRRPKLRTSIREAPKKNKDDDDEDDNWEVPEGDIPYCNF